MTKRKCRECGGSGHKEVSVKCIRCNGSGEVLDDSGKVVDCKAPGCFFGNIKLGSSNCPKCDGTGYEP